MNRRKLTMVLQRTAAVLEKCGGPGGKPGPCPISGGKPKQRDSHKHSATAFKKSDSLSSGKLKEHIAKAMASVSAAKQAAESGKHQDAAKHHVSAARHHTSFFAAHQQKAEVFRKSGNEAQAKLHDAAAKAHRKAADSHVASSEDHEKQHRAGVFRR